MKTMRHQDQARDGSLPAFTLIELLAVIAVIAILAAMLMPAVVRSKSQATKISCIDNVKQLALSMQIYVDDNHGFFPPRTRYNLWPSRIFDGYRDLRILICPNDGPDDPASWIPNPPAGMTFPADGKPRSYMYNGWNDYMASKLSDADMSAYMHGTYDGPTMKENVILRPSDLVVLGEKLHTSKHYHMDLMETDPSTGGVGNDLYELNRSRHGAGGRSDNGSTSGGSNYSFADGSVRFIKFNDILSPENMWAVTDAGRTNFAAQP